MPLTPTLRSQLEAFAVRVGTEFKTVYARIGSLASLSTTAKGSVVAAINEVNAKASTSEIDDSAASSNKAYSSTKTTQLIANSAAQVKTDIVGGAAAAYDTLVEIQGLLQGEDAQIGTLLAGQAQRLRLDAAGSYTTTQQQQGRDNLDVYGKADLGDLSTMNLVTTFENALT